MHKFFNFRIKLRGSFFTVFFCIMSFYGYQYIIRLIPNSIMTDLMIMYRISSKEIASFASMYYLGYIFFHIPLGFMILRFNNRLIVSISILLTGFSLIPIIFSNQWWFVLVGRFLSGIGSSCAILIGYRVFHKMYYKHFTQMVGAMICFGVIVGFFSERYLYEIMLLFGMRYVLAVLFCFSLLLCFFNYYFFPNFKNSYQEKQNVKEDIKLIFLNKKAIIISFCAAFMVGPLEGFADAWGSLFLVKFYDLDKIFADHIVSYILLGMALGVIILPYFADRFGVHYFILVISCFFMATAFLCILSIDDISIFTVKNLLLVIGFFCAYQSIFVGLVLKFIPDRLRTLAASISNMIQMSFGIVIHKVMGFILDTRWNGEIGLENVRLYSKEDLRVAIYFIPILLIVAFFILVFMKVVFKQKI